MNLVAALARLTAFERSIGSLYDWLAQVLPDEEFAATFGRLALQEQNHANLLEHMRRVAIHGGKGANLVELDVTELDSLVDTAEALRCRGTQPDLLEAVTAAMLVELSAAERIHGAMISDADLSLGALFTSLARDDDRHLRLLMDVSERIERTAA